ncbi:MAG: hypothetical protein COA97_06705 [Flavobacteriales bacterium]|nr:MAG: hypothetical protein COA97_06705 [Flavobacteriales bacterium]
MEKYGQIKANVMESNILTGYGKSFASFGEIIQGRKSNNEDFLITIPIDLWSICTLTMIQREGPRVINSNFEKSKQVAVIILDKLGVVANYELNISFSRSIPIGKGLSSSTADMLSTIRALQELFGFLLRPKVVSSIFKTIEPHDGLMYKSSVCYNHRTGTLLEDLDYVPKINIIAIDFGGVVDSIEYNKKLKYSDDILKQYDHLYDETINAFKNEDDYKIAQCATRSLEIDLISSEDAIRKKVLDSFKTLDAMGIINTHSGTCIGLIYPNSLSKTELKSKEEKVSSLFGYPTFSTSSLNLLT